VGFTFSPFVIFLILEGGRGGINYYFLIFKPTFEKGRGVWVYLFFLYLLLIFYYLYSFVTFFTSCRGRVAWVLFFSLFVIFCSVC